VVAINKTTVFVTGGFGQVNVLNPSTFKFYPFQFIPLTTFQSIFHSLISVWPFTQQWTVLGQAEALVFIQKAPYRKVLFI